MINIGITGGETVAAGELVRLLINHPDVNLKWVSAKGVSGKLSGCHKGLLGECDAEFTSPSVADVDLVFSCDSDASLYENVPEEVKATMRIVDFGHSITNVEPCMYGLCEINRKFMVHDCYGVVRLPSAQAMLLLLALIPAAKNNMLNGSISSRINCGTMITPANEGELGTEVCNVLKVLQPDYDGRIEITCGKDSSSRGMVASLTMPCQLDAGAIKSIYKDYYGDHNFTFVGDEAVDMSDVINTNKCLINIEVADGMAHITAFDDGLLKGAAGNAVHVMNLLFGFHEKVGLALKAQVF